MSTPLHISLPASGWGPPTRNWTLWSCWQMEVANLIFKNRGTLDLESMANGFNTILTSLRLDEFGMETLKTGSFTLIQVDESNPRDKYNSKLDELMFRVVEPSVDEEEGMEAHSPKFACAYAGLARVLSCVLKAGDFLMISGGYDVKRDHPVITLNFGNTEMTQLIRINPIPVYWRGKILLHESMTPSPKDDIWFKFKYVSQWIDKTTKRLSRRELVRHDTFILQRYLRARTKFPKPSDTFERAVQVFTKLKNYSLMDDDDDEEIAPSRLLIQAKERKRNIMNQDFMEDDVIMKPIWKKQREGDWKILIVLAAAVLACLLYSSLLNFGRSVLEQDGRSCDSYINSMSKIYNTNILEKVLNFLGMSVTDVETII